MTQDWTCRYLVTPGSLAADHIGRILQAARGVGLNGTDSGDVRAITGDGTGSLNFRTVDGAIEWLARNDGLVQLVSNDDIDLSISLHRADGMLPIEMEWLPDVPRFDVCALNIDHRVGEMSGFWPKLSILVEEVASITEAAFVYAMSEEAIEATRSHQCVHQRVAADRLPAVLGWLVAALSDSPLADQLRRVGALLGINTTDRDDYVYLHLTKTPWPPPDIGIIERASARMREVIGDQGCSSDPRSDHDIQRVDSRQSRQRR